MVNQCVICGAEMSEGGHVCAACEAEMAEKVEGLKYGTVLTPPEPNTELSFGLDSGPNFLISYRRAKPLSKFQIWMFNICFGIRARNI